MTNRGWTDNGGGETMASTARQSGNTTATGDADPFTRASKLADLGTPLPDPFGERDDLFEPPGQMSTHN